MDLSATEIVIIFTIALLVLGPDELVKYSVQLGRFAAKMKTQFENFKKMTQEEIIKRADLDKQLSGDSLGEIRDKIKGVESELNRSLSGAVHSEPNPPAARPEILSADEIENNLMAFPAKGPHGGY